jgi:sec-independent protein translocase protein TatA
MIPQIGIAEIAIVLIIALIVFGPRKLPDLGRSLGRGLREFREGVSSISASVQEPDEEDDADLPEQSPAEAEAVEVDVEEVPAPSSGPADRG